MKTNIFLNSYQQPENKLTYNFLSILEYLNDKETVEFLTGLKADKEKPVENIQTVYGGGETNPDGSFDVIANGKKITILYENKTNRRKLDPQQLIGHLKERDKDVLLLVTTPRVTDRKIVEEINDKRIIFKTWGEFATFLTRNYKNDFIISNFVEYGKQSGEFESLCEFSKEDIKTFCGFQKLNFDRKIQEIFKTFIDYFNSDINRLFKKMVFSYKNQWGRCGAEFGNEKENTYGQFGALSYYFDTYDHGIDFKEDSTPEICFFFDVHADKKYKLQQDEKVRKIVDDLIPLGFESNLGDKLTKNNNAWRLLVYRRSITAFDCLTPQVLSLFANEVFEKLVAVQANEHAYFKELI